jgi:3-hydroxyisobutyrate dehydrogenase
MRTVSSRGYAASASVSRGGGNKPTCGFIGLGNMGASMALNLLKAGNSVVVHDLNAAAVERLREAGAHPAASIKELCADAEVVVTMLPSSPHVEAVLCDAGGVLTHLRTGGMVIDASTIDPNVSKRVAKAASQAKVDFVDAPVSGGVGGAAAGTLTFMVGGSKEAFERAKPILQAMGRNIVHCGGVGLGQAVKVCNNLVLGISMVGVSEAMNLGIKLGLDPKLLAGIFNTSSARCWSSDTYNPVPGVMENVPASRGYSGGFGVDLMRKDLGLALSAAEAIHVSLPMGSRSKEVYDAISAAGQGGMDFSIAYDHFSKEKK